MNNLEEKWQNLKDKTAKRKDDLDDSLEAQQYFADANEAESWMKEKEPIVTSEDYGKDEDTAEVSNFNQIHKGCVQLASLCRPCGAHVGEPLTRANLKVTHPLTLS